MGRDDNYWQHSFREQDSFTKRTRTRTRPGRAPVPVELGPPLTPAILAAQPRPALLARPRRPELRPPQPELPPPVPDPEDDGLHDCAVDRWCRAATLLRDHDGKITGKTPARSSRAACSACVAATGEALQHPKDGADIPALYVHLSLELDKLGGAPGIGHAPFGPRLALRGDIDELMRTMVIVLVSWHARVAALPQLRLTVPALRSAAADPGRYLQRAAQVLAPPERLNALVALQPAEMERTVDGWVDWPELHGGHACREILDLHTRAQWRLGQIVPQPEALVGVPCRREGCDGFTLYRADPPSDPAKPLMFSQCSRCGDLMDETSYRGWVKWYKEWAESTTLTCRRCQRNKHELCAWQACECRARGHAAA